MGIKASEQIRSVMAFPGDRYGIAPGGSTGPFLNGAASPGTTGPMGATGPLGGPIDTQNFDRALVTVMSAGLTGASPNEQVAFTAFHGAVPWFSDSSVTGVYAGTTQWAITAKAADSKPFKQIGDLRLENLQRYLWIRSAETGFGEAKLSVQVDLMHGDKLPPGDQVAAAENT